MAVLINPGTSPTPVFAYDNLLFFPADCRTCLVAKPARSKHCSLCGRCVQLFDHHCIWLNNDVGYYTYRYFIGFLVAKIWTFTYGAYLCWTALGVSPTMFWTTLRATSTENKITGTLFLLCVLLLPLVALFLGEHLRYIYLGVTTNETAKWDYIHYLMQNKLLYKDGSQFLVVDEMGYTTLTGAPINATRPAPVTSWDQLTNIYDHGFVSNLKQRLFPKPL
ncbi:hypothetical protein OGAPHI_002687 [Ogataea philodendri]|uniref:Palmitoyltransferase n=1 Tax=Ogataea philodendri TaxID=1378263 RepID=A0A9P8PBR2_9ASCO|nr:uncharacterized protein OGAPHI_002687 [Ogataea philodendri]KAH3668932.1 hypothetical protein OGAPHI_002687 [Ogataea philodendri]